MRLRSRPLHQLIFCIYSEPIRFSHVKKHKSTRYPFGAGPVVGRWAILERAPSTTARPQVLTAAAESDLGIYSEPVRFNFYV